MSYLILGTSKCDFCVRAKLLLEDENIAYRYCDLESILGDWRDIFKKDLCHGSKSIPLIFKEATGTNTSLEEIGYSGSWRFIGGFNELRKEIISSSLSDDSY
jgi:glutaredoxin